jgi:hypothetical protein
MSKSELQYAQEDEAVCTLLRGDGTSPRWIIITAFYAALRYVNHYVFPCTVEEASGQVGLAHDLIDYITKTADDTGKHILRQRLLREKLADEGHTTRIFRKYRALQDASEKARYDTRDQDERDADYAWARLCAIRDFCTGQKDDEDASGVAEAVPVIVMKRGKQQ